MADTTKDGDCLRYDVFSHGKSISSEHFLAKSLRPPVRHHDHAKMVTGAYLESSLGSGQDERTKSVVIGLSLGGGIANDFVLSHPDLVGGVHSILICAGISVVSKIQLNRRRASNMFNQLQIWKMGIEDLHIVLVYV